VDPDKFARDLADGVNKVIADKDLARSMAAKGRKRVEETFDWAAIAQEVESLYLSLI
jgi:glycosyltransferase involved in cell wall biosynthesis